MSLSSVSIKRPVLTTVMSVVIVVFGIIGYTFLGIRDFPSVDPPIISVSTSYAGANSDVIESQITEPLEKAINGVPGIRNISSTSSVGSSNITVEFDLDADLETAANDVRDKVSQAQRQLPQDITSPPVVTKADANADNILTISVTSDTRNINQVNDYAENVLQEGLQTIPGVSAINIHGQRQYAMRLWIDPAKLSSLGLAASDITAALDRENVELPAGKIEGNSTELIIRAIGKMSTEKEFNDLIIRSDSNRVVRLRDVGYALLGSANEQTAFKESGSLQVALAIVPQPGANYVQIAKDFYARFEQLKKDLPPDIHVKVLTDNTKFIKQSITEVEETLAISFILVVIIIYLFFRDWLIAFRPLIDIPVSLIGAFFLMYIFGYSINILTLLGIVLATGLVVDDGIVVTENIYKKIEEGMAVRKAAFEGSAEILFAVVSTSITLAAVFLPIMFLQGFTGRLFREFAVVVAGSVLISAFVSLSLTPMLSVKLIRKDQKKSNFYIKTEPFFVNMTNSYSESLVNFMKHRWIAIVILFGSVGIIWVLNGLIPSELAPLDDKSQLRYNVTGAEGASYEFMTKNMDDFSNLVADSIPEANVNIEIVAAGRGGSGAVNNGFGRIGLVPPDERERSQQEIADWLTKKVGKFPDVRVNVSQEQTISGGGGRSSQPIQFVVQNQDFEKIRKVLPDFFDKVSKSSVFVTPDVDLKFTKPEIRIITDRERARDLGVSVQDIAQTLQLYYSAGRVAYFLLNGKQYQVVAQVDRANRDQPLDLKTIYVRNDKGGLIQLDNVAKIDEDATPPSIYHFNRFKSATFQAGLSPGHTIGDGIAEMNRIAKETLDESFSTTLSGASRDFAESSSNILFAFIFALLLVYLVLAAQFESFKDPIIVMLTVPLAVAGAFLSLWLFDQSLNIFSQIGIITLVGLVTKNGILIVEFANQKMEHGMEKYQAVVEAATARLRPILMTSLAVVLGSVPIALALGAGAKSRVSLGIVIIGGMLFSLVLTLYVIPTMYLLIASRVRKDPDVEDPEEPVKKKKKILLIENE
ncbi:efflux RND transporter permease subunit [Mucilaginibacter antarcticus]|uniref:Efflux RND transporter permease subunit n=1 Tax=Mucilaginibacter antarcticus TaxID=1855725 RepID=A0ABW5XM06_9SPHI